MIRRTVVCCLCMTMLPSLASADLTVDFDELANYSNSGSSGSYFDGHGPDASSGGWSTQGVSFNTGQYGPGWGYSNVNDPTTPGYLNQFAAITGTDFSGSGNKNYVTSYYNGSDPIINLPNDYSPSSVYVTNTSYAYWSMFSGDDFAKKFGGDSGTDPDYLVTTFKGFDGPNGTGTSTGSVPFYLADFRSSDSAGDYIIDSWQLVDLTGLGKAKSITYSVESSDFLMTDFGPISNTPTYIAIDSLTLVSAPEPSTFTLLGFASAAVTMMRRRRSSRRVSSRRVS